MLAESLLLLLSLLAGAAVQLAGAPARLRDAAWVAFFWMFSPVLVFVTFLTVDLDEGLGRALAAAILASWLVGLAAYGYARLVATERDERGALTLAGGFGNTGFVGFPLAQLAYGADGLALAVLYDRLSWLVPTSRGAGGCAPCLPTRRCTPSGLRSCSVQPGWRCPGRVRPRISSAR